MKNTGYKRFAELKKKIMQLSVSVIHCSKEKTTLLNLLSEARTLASDYVDLPTDFFSGINDDNRLLLTNINDVLKNLHKEFKLYDLGSKNNVKALLQLTSELSNLLLAVSPGRAEEINRLVYVGVEHFLRGAPILARDYEDLITLTLKEMICSKYGAVSFDGEVLSDDLIAELYLEIQGNLKHNKTEFD